MSIRKRPMRNGKETSEYHYDFTQSGKRYWGVCEGCSTKAAALAYEKKLRDTVKKMTEQKSVTALVENYKRELTGGTSVPLAEAFDLAQKKPRARTASETQLGHKRSYWQDFLEFMKATHPDVEALDQVQKTHAEEYIQHLRTKGRFNKVVSYVVDGKERVNATGKDKEKLLSPRTINVYQQTMAEVFKLLAEDAGLQRNPFTEIQKLANDPGTREAFTEDELRTIMEKADTFMKPLFMIAISTALREGDICTLRWSDIDFNNAVINRMMNKTQHLAQIPILPPLLQFLNDLRQNAIQDADNEFSAYVLPDHAKMYLSNPSGVSYRIKQFLEKDCEITTTKQVPGRTRAISVKDLHSCRHTFCYFAGLYGIPLNIVQSIVGHMTPEMTAHYSAHASLEAKREKMKQLPDFMFGLTEKSHNEIIDVTAEPMDNKEKLRMLIEKMSSEDVDIILRFAERRLSPPVLKHEGATTEEY